jgi:ubiquinone/menaquinone biosynthesis C-methylase UbiE
MRNEASPRVFYEEFHGNAPVDAVNPVVQAMQKKRCDYLRSLMNDCEGRVLVIGCGSQDDMSIINEICAAVGIDISETAIRKEQKKYPRHQYCIGDATNLPFDKDNFDVVVCSEVIEHIPQDERALSEVRRVLKNDGAFILTTSNWISLYGLLRKTAEAIFKRPFTAASQPIDRWTTAFSLRNKLERMGFQILLFRGLWYYPPTGRGRRQIPAQLILPIIRITYPLELLFRKVLPWFGHMLLFKARARKCEK